MKKTIIFLFLFLLNSFVSADEYKINEFGFYIDIPVGWKIVDASNPAVISFSNKEGNTIFQIFTFDGSTFNNSSEISNFIKTKLNASTEEANFTYADRDSIIADISFNAGQIQVRGYAIYISGEDYDLALIAYSSVETYEKNHYLILSALDSFAISKDERLTPGPINQFYYVMDEKNKRNVDIVIEGKPIHTTLDDKELEASSVLIDREAKILATYKPEIDDIVKAWKRYYNTIYRDNYQRIKKVTDIVMKELDLNNKSNEEKAKRILKWIQNFSYKQDKSIANLTSPLDAIYSFSGDCDSRVLLLAMILDQIGIDSIMLVSTKYMHAAIGIDINEEGAKISFEGKDYLYAELMDNVEIGMVPQKMADPTGWIPLKLGYK